MRPFWNKLAGGGSRVEALPRQLSPILVWAVVFSDIGTSVYYVPGILYSQVRDLAPLFVIGTTIGFLLLAAKYVEICWRNPEGGGVVTVATKAFSPWWGGLGGMLIIVDYFLTSAISAVSGIHYLGSVFPALDGHALLFTIAALIGLAAINTIGIRESAMLALVMAAAAVAVDLAVIGTACFTMGPADWTSVGDRLRPAEGIPLTTLLVGFAGAWLSFSGLESISQLSPAMRQPIRASARRGMLLVVATVLVTSPLLTLFSVSLLPEEVKRTEIEHYISELGAVVGGWPLKLAVVATGSALLLFAANTAIIGAYHVFLALAERRYFPGAITLRNRRFGTPHFAIWTATIVPVLIVLFARGSLEILGGVYAFGLLGTFVLSSAGLDVLRWRDRQRGPIFWVGVLTTAMVVVAWAVNIFAKQDATIFGGVLVAIGMGIAAATQRGWIEDLIVRVPLFARMAQRRISQAEEVSGEHPSVVSLSEAHVLASLYPARTLVAVRGHNRRLIAEAILREKGLGGGTIYALYVEERPGLFVGYEPEKLNEEGIATLRFASEAAKELGFPLIPVWTVSYSAAEAIARAASTLGVDAVMMGVSRRSAIYHLLRGHVVSGLIRRLPRDCHLILQN